MTARKRTLRVGVTGHRYLEDPAGVVEAFRHELDALSRIHDPDGIVLLSSLAEGADQLSARLAAGRRNTSLAAILPMSAEEYCKDFTDERARQAFRDLLEAADDVVVMPEAGNRRRAYAEVGRYVVDHCDVLIAAWDGLPARGRGGTAEVVEYARSMHRPVRRIDCRTPASATDGPAVPSTGVDPGQTASSLQAWKHLLERSFERTRGSFSADTADRLRARLDTVVGHYGDDCDAAGRRADRLQTRYRRTSYAVFLLAVLAVLIVSCQSLFHLDQWVVGGEVIAIAVILVLFQIGKRSNWHLHWMEHRLESEWSRHGAFAAFLSGETIPGIDRHWACRWVRDSDAVTRIRRKRDALPPLGERPDDGLPVLKDFMAEAWLEDQRRYHAAKSRREMTKHESISRYGEWLFWLTFVVAVVHLVPHAVLHGWHLPDRSIAAWLTLLAVGLPTLGSAFAGMRSHFEYNKIASRSAMMADHLSELQLDLQGADDFADLDAIVRETETLMLQENSDWYFTIGMHHLEKA